MKSLTLRESFPSDGAIITRAPEETFALGVKTGGLLRPGDIIAFRAPLGAGKTVFTKGVARALGVTENVTSPTYTVISEYEGRFGMFYHIDAYRLGGAADFENSGGAEILNSGAICVVEWSERIEELLPPSVIIVSIKICEDEKREFRYAYSD